MSILAAFLGGLAVRAVRVAVEASPYILLGLAASGLLRATVGPARLRRSFGDGRWSGPVRAWAAGTMLPVCSLGVLPVVRELRRSGVRRGAVLTFALAAPMFNPVTLLSASSHMDLGLLGLLVATSAAVSIAAGVIAGGGGSADGPDEPPPAAGRPRGAAAAVHALREASGGVWIDLGAGLAAAAIVSATVSPAFLAEGTFADDPRAAARMAVVAAPAYVSPEVGVTALPEMVKFRQASGAMLALIVLGVGLSVGHLTWATRAYGPSAALRWAAAVAVATLVGAWGLDRIAAPVGVANPDNDHYDAMISPIAPEHASAAFRRMGEALARSGPGGLVAPAALAVAVILGAALRSGRLGPKSRFEDWTTPDDGRAASGLFDHRLPAWSARAVVGGAAFAALAAGACVAFPSPEEAFRDMTVIKADYYGEINLPDLAAPMHHLDLWERAAARLPIGSALRLHFPGAEARRLTSDLSAALRELRRLTASGDRESARSGFIAAQGIYDRCRRAYGVD
ncbi:MAG: hypothetical protein BGO49_19715 [Planctomycetales bacterium 71-10]|nr:MAG: hypothetical protein BGO49_19715 [Planctomycetales bacterium 71-10]